ncbi:type II secretion system protein [Aliivibrio wodanis]|uniref:type II secretion system protein n=1 Tax=Aliivibrio wodanis TaxID=80852 RepID=UPI00406C51E6
MKNKGFTLIELVVVIVMLGVLSVIAAPRFLNLQDDAKTSVIKGIKSSIDSALNIAYGKLAIEGLESEALLLPGEVPIDGCGQCLFSYGYPKRDFDTFYALVNGVGEGEDIQLAYTIEATSAPTLFFTFSDNIIDDSGFPTIKNDSCYVKYEAVVVNAGDDEKSSDYVLTVKKC